jgi:hypothetical protein
LLILQEQQQLNATTHYFSDGPTPMIFYALQGIGASNCDTDETIPKQFKFQNTTSSQFLFTRVHIYIYMYLNFVYNGLRSGFVAHSSAEKRPVVGVWFVKSL